MRPRHKAAEYSSEFDRDRDGGSGFNEAAA